MTSYQDVSLQNDRFVNPDSFSRLAEQILKNAQSSGADTVETIIYQTYSVTVELAKNIVETIERSESKDVSIRVFQGKKQACLSTSNFSQNNLSRLIDRAMDMIKYVPEDKYCGLVPLESCYQGTYETQLNELELYDPGLANPKELESCVQKMETSALEFHQKIKQVEASASWDVSSFWMSNTNGFAQGGYSSNYTLSAVTIAEQEGVMERDYDYCSRRWQKDMNTPEEIGRNSAKRTLEKLGAKKIKSSQMNIIFENRIAKSLIKSFIQAISGSAITRGNSFLKAYYEKPVFGANIDIIDHPLLKRGNASRIFDGEGVETKIQTLVKDGILQSWLLNSSSANQLNMPVNGFASFGFGSPPSVTPSNLSMKPGTASLKEMISSLKKGVFITDIFSPSVNMNTGDYSVGGSGFLIENGKISQAINEITIAGNLINMFKTLEPANDLKGIGGYDIPSLFIPNLTLAGN